MIDAIIRCFLFVLLLTTCNKPNLVPIDTIPVPDRIFVKDIEMGLLPDGREELIGLTNLQIELTTNADTRIFRGRLDSFPPSGMLAPVRTTGVDSLVLEPADFRVAYEVYTVSGLPWGIGDFLIARGQALLYSRYADSIPSAIESSNNLRIKYGVTYVYG